MCGIAILFRPSGAPADERPVDRMVRTLRHRGPDAQGTEPLGPACLGHTRLSIVDLEGGTQPMSTLDGRFTLTYNGELYNFGSLRRELEEQGVSFRTNCDTEVVLAAFAAWGVECVERFRGMFAFAVYDSLEQRLTLVRDRLGIKPLFYARGEDCWVAASEIKALFASGLVEPELEPDSVHNHFLYQFSCAPSTPFRGVRELEPGCWLQVGVGGDVREGRYWDLEFPRHDEYEEGDDDHWQRRWLDGLVEAADCHTIGDVPIGAYLSGGIDSATTTHLLHRARPEGLRAFSIGFDNPLFDESRIFRSIAEHHDLTAHELVVEDEGDYFDTLVDALYALEQPQRLAVDLPQFLLSQAVQEQGYKVVYTGEGADEILAGYACYRDAAATVWNPDGGTEAPTALAAATHQKLIERLHAPQEVQNTLKRFGCYPAWYDSWQLTGDLLPEMLIPRSGPSNHPDAAEELFERCRPALTDRHPVNQSLYLETKTRLPGWVLWKGDRLTMAHGVEARVPFVDHKLAELTARMPPWMKLRDGEEKFVLRRSMIPRLPAHPSDYRKRPFATPSREWFFSPRRVDRLEPFLGEEALVDAGWFEPAVVRRWLHELATPGRPADPDAFYRTMRLEWMLFLALSIQVLHHLFVRRNAPCFQA